MVALVRNCAISAGILVLGAGCSPPPAAVGAGWAELGGRATLRATTHPLSSTDFGCAGVEEPVGGATLWATRMGAPKCDDHTPSRAARLRDGWVTGWDFGEWGSTYFWKPDGRPCETVDLLADVGHDAAGVPLSPIVEGLVAVDGQLWMMIRYGAGVSQHRGAPAAVWRWSPATRRGTLLTELPEVVGAAVAAREGGAAMGVGDTGILRIASDGSIRRLHAFASVKLRTRVAFAESTREGSLLLYTPDGVVELDAQPSGDFLERWWVPRSCPAG